MSNEAFHTALPCIQIRFDGFPGILRRFAKCTLLPDGLYLSRCVGQNVRIVSFVCLEPGLMTPFITFRFVDAAHLLESKTPKF